MVAGMALGFMVVGAPSCQPAEPAMTITGAVESHCGDHTLSGVVAPAKATTKVVVQRTVGGKWVDWKWYETTLNSEPLHALAATPNKATGAYSVRIAFGHSDGIGKPITDLTGTTIHLRVRSNGGSATSPGWYWKMPPYETGC